MDKCEVQFIPTIRVAAVLATCAFPVLVLEIVLAETASRFELGLLVVPGVGGVASHQNVCRHKVYRSDESFAPEIRFSRSS
jgi:hypothetical protein